MAVHIFPTVNDCGPYAGMGKTISEVNLTALIKALLAQNFVVSGFTVPGSDPDLILPVAAGEAAVSGYRVVIDTSTDVTCTASATNHIFLKLTKDALSNVTGAVFEVNTTGTAPADSVKIATAVADASSITSTTDARVTLALADLGLIKTVDGAGSGLDADLLRGQAPTSAATANTVMIRDASGRAKVAAPLAADDIARKDTVDSAVTSWYGLGNTVLLEALTERTVATKGPSIVKEFFLTNPGRYRITFDVYVPNGDTMYIEAQIFSGDRTTVSGSQPIHKDTLSTTVTTYTSYTIDMSRDIHSAMYICIAIYTDTGTSCYIRNVRIKGIPVATPAKAVLVN